MPIQIINNGASIRFLSDTAEKLVMKHTIRQVTIQREESIQIELDAILKTMVFRHSDVALPVTSDATALVTAINTMITDCVCSKACDCGIR